jgi:hypothetical protein
MPGPERIDVAYLKRRWPHGPPLSRAVADEQGHRTFIVAFSTGKDSVAMALALKEAGYAMRPYYCYLVPGLGFVEESLSYYEERIFEGVRIARVPHPFFFRALTAGLFQTPHDHVVNNAASLDAYGYAEIQATIAAEHGLSDGTFTALGTRAADSVMRRVAINTNGPVNRAAHRFQAIWQMNLADVLDIVGRHQIELSPEYRVMPRSFDGLNYEYLIGIREAWPDDYRRIVEWFPLVEAELFRFERMLS